MGRSPHPPQGKTRCLSHWEGWPGRLACYTLSLGPCCGAPTLSQLIPDTEQVATWFLSWHSQAMQLGPHPSAQSTPSPPPLPSIRGGMGCGPGSQHT